MDQISNAELIELIALFESSIDVQYQVWMAATFALIVASYGSRGKLSILVRAIIASIYLLAVVAIFLRWETDRMRIGLFVVELANRGIDVDVVDWLPFFRRASFWLGTVAATSFVFYFHKLVSRS